MVGTREHHFQMRSGLGRNPIAEILGARSQSIPGSIPGVRDGVGKDGVSGDSRVFHTDNSGARSF